MYRCTMCSPACRPSAVGYSCASAAHRMKDMHATLAAGPRSANAFPGQCP